MSAREAIRYVTPASTTLHPVPADLLDDEMRNASPRHKRLFVGGWAFSGDATNVDALSQAMRTTLELYELRAPGLLDRPTTVSVQSIIGELEGIVGPA